MIADNFIFGSRFEARLLAADCLAATSEKSIGFMALEFQDLPSARGCHAQRTWDHRAPSRSWEDEKTPDATKTLPPSGGIAAYAALPAQAKRRTPEASQTKSSDAEGKQSDDANTDYQYCNRNRIVIQPMPTLYPHDAASPNKETNLRRRITHNSAKAELC